MKDLPKRTTRGRRIKKLTGQQAVFDHWFWNQPMFQERDSDEDYATDSDNEQVSLSKRARSTKKGPG